MKGGGLVFRGGGAEWQTQALNRSVFHSLFFFLCQSEVQWSRGPRSSCAAARWSSGVRWVDGTRFECLFRRAAASGSAVDSTSGFVQVVVQCEARRGTGGEPEGNRRPGVQNHFTPYFTFHSTFFTAFNIELIQASNTFGFNINM